jgi:hypothetical protein
MSSLRAVRTVRVERPAGERGSDASGRCAISACGVPPSSSRNAAHVGLTEIGLNWPGRRTHRWMNRFRRVLIRWEKRPENYLAMLHFACGIITWGPTRLSGNGLRRFGPISSASDKPSMVIRTWMRPLHGRFRVRCSGSVDQ